MRWSQSLIPTLRQAPTDAVALSHQLMLRAGCIQQIAGGAYTYLPLGLRVLNKVMHIIRQQMNNAGAAEVLMPTLQPIEWWEQTGRREAYGENLFVVTDRHGRQQALGPTHEEVITMLVKTHVNSYRQLPLTLYQIQTKFRDEFRPRFGVLRSREFQMKDAYSFHMDLESLGKTYDLMHRTYCNIFNQCGVPFVVVEAEAGPIGGNASHEFMVPSPTGEDTILSCDRTDYAANVEKAEIGKREHSFDGEPTGELETVHTPQAPSIEAVGKLMKVKPKHMLKTLICRSAERWVVAVVRGDHELNENKLRAACDSDLTLADDTEAKANGFAIGYVGPHVVVGRDDVQLIVDPDAAQPGFWASGANRPDHHVKHFNWQRDVIQPLGDQAETVIQVADIRNAMAGDRSPRDPEGVLRESKGIEVGHIFKLGTKYSQALGLKVLDANQDEQTVIMGCYGIGVNRIIAAAIESDAGHDDNGMIWPMAIAPFHVLLTTIRYEGEVKTVADDLYQQLTDAGVEVLLDDRDERPGVKFKDADLIGIPLRLTIGAKGLANGQVELKARDQAKPEIIQLDQVAEHLQRLIRTD